MLAGINGDCSPLFFLFLFGLGWKTMPASHNHLPSSGWSLGPEEDAEGWLLRRQESTLLLLLLECYC